MMRLGLGIYVYLNQMFGLIWMFLLLTILAGPILWFYSKNDAYKIYTIDADGQRILEKPGTEIFSLGNLGYATAQCVHAPLNVGSMSLTCSYGRIGKILDYGVNDVSQTNMID